MHARNKTSRYQIIMAIFERMAEMGRISTDEAHAIVNKYQQKLFDNIDYIKEFGIDTPEIDNWAWKAEVDNTQHISTDTSGDYGKI